MNAVWILVLLLTSGGRQSPVTSNPTVLVQEFGTFRDALPAGAPSNGRLSEIEERRAAVYRELRMLDAVADPALTRGLADADVRVRRGAALYLLEAGGNYSRIAPRGLDLTRFLDPLVQALRDPDQRVKELSAQAVGLIGPAAAVAVPELVRLLADPAEGLRNTACIGLAASDWPLATPSRRFATHWGTPSPTSGVLHNPRSTKSSVDHRSRQCRQHADEDVLH